MFIPTEQGRNTSEAQLYMALLSGKHLFIALHPSDAKKGNVFQASSGSISLLKDGRLVFPSVGGLSSCIGINGMMMTVFYGMQRGLFSLKLMDAERKIISKKRIGTHQSLYEIVINEDRQDEVRDALADALNPESEECFVMTRAAISSDMLETQKRSRPKGSKKYLGASGRIYRATRMVWYGASHYIVQPSDVAEAFVLDCHKASVSSDDMLGDPDDLIHQGDWGFPLSYYYTLPGEAVLREVDRATYESPDSVLEEAQVTHRIIQGFTNDVQSYVEEEARKKEQLKTIRASLEEDKAAIFQKFSDL